MYLDWLLAGLTLRLARWEELINKVKQYKENLHIWLRDICFVWEQVSDLIVCFGNIKLSIWKHTIDEYTLAKISLMIHFYWEYRKQHLMLKLVSKLKATWSVFVTQDVIFNEKKVSNILDISNITKIEAIIAEKPKAILRKNKKQKN